MTTQTETTTVDVITERKPPKGFFKALDAYFGFSARKTNLTTEIFAGVAMFLTMACFMFVNAELVSSGTNGNEFYQYYYASALVAVVTTILMGVVCNVPFVQATSLGMTVLIVSIYGNNAGLTYANVLAITLVSSLVLTAVMFIKPCREFLQKAIPLQIRKALPVALGAYLIVYVLVQSGLVTTNTLNASLLLDQYRTTSGNAIPNININYLTFTLGEHWYDYMPIVMGAVAFVALVVMKRFNVKHAVFISLVGSLGVYLIAYLFHIGLIKALLSGDTGALKGCFVDYDLFAFFTPAYGGQYFYQSSQLVQRLFGNQLKFAALTRGFDFSAYTATEGSNVVALFATSVLSFLVVGVSETGATVQGCGALTESLDDNARYLYEENKCFGKVSFLGNVYAINAFGSVLGSLLGVGPVVARPESAVGASEGGKTGVSAIVGGLLFIVAMFSMIFSGVFINGLIVYGIIFYVALTLLVGLKNCDFGDFMSALPFLAVVVATAISMNLAKGIACGMVTYAVTKLLTFKIKEVSISTWILSAVLLIYLFI